MGMSYQEYWYGDPWLVVVYAEAYRLKKQHENERLWLQGMYFYDAISVALKRFGDGLSGKRSSDNVTYPKEPYPLYQKEKTEAEKQAELEKEAEAERQRAYEQLDRIVKAYKARKKQIEEQN